MHRNEATNPSKYRRHASGQARVTIDGKDHYLGTYGSPASRQKYRRLIAEWIEGRGRLGEPEPTTQINDVLLAYWKHAQGYYRHANGRPTSELQPIRQCLRLLRHLYGHTPAEEFTPRKLKAVRRAMIDKGWSRKSINMQIGRIKRLFAWGVEEEHVHVAIHQALLRVGGLQRGRSAARKTTKISPVPDAHVYAVEPFVSRQVWAMIQLQLLTGARPGEVCQMRAVDIEMAGKVWVYRPAQHKNSYRGRDREILIGPKGQSVIRSFLRSDLTAFLFDPRDAETERQAARRKSRKTPLYESHLRHLEQKRSHSRTRPPQGRYTVWSYRNSIRRACERAFPLPEHLGPRRLTDGKVESCGAWRQRLTDDEKSAIQEWHRSHVWHPHQLRHNAATRLRREFGVEVARIVLGHASAFTTELYTELDRSQAIEVMKKTG